MHTLCMPVKLEVHTIDTASSFACIVPDASRFLSFPDPGHLLPADINSIRFLWIRLKVPMNSLTPQLLTNS